MNKKDWDGLMSDEPHFVLLDKFEGCKEQLRASNEALKKVNKQAEHFEREWYLQCDKNEAANEALVAAEVANRTLRDAFEDIESKFIRGELKHRNQIPHYEAMVGNLTALRQHDKEVRAKALEEAADKLSGILAFNVMYPARWVDGSYLEAAQELHLMASEIRAEG